MGNTSSYPYYHTRLDCFPEIWCQNWMKDVPDSTSLADLTIPGTHSSHSVMGMHYHRTQSWSLTTQFEAGIRFLDLEFQDSDGQLGIYHHTKHQATTVNQCIEEAGTFLKREKCKSEVILLRLSHWDFSNKRHSPTLEQLLLENEFIWKPPPGEVHIPNVGDVRGKIVIFQNMAGSVVGIPKHILASVEENIQVSTLFSIRNKWEKVKKHLEEANTCEKGKIYLTFVCGAGSAAFPYSVAYRINFHLFEYLKKETKTGKVKFGIIALDFPGCELIETLIKTNYVNCEEEDFLY